MQGPSKREITLRIFRGENYPGVLFQPRIEPWLAQARMGGMLPVKYRHLDVFEFYEALGLSMRYIHYFTGLPDPIERSYAPDVRVRYEATDRARFEIVETPHGELVTEYAFHSDGGFRTVGFPVREPEDLPKLKWLLPRLVYTFNEETYALADERMGPLGVPQFWVPKSPYQAMAHDWMHYEDFVYAFHDEPEEMEEVFEAIDRSYDDLYRQITAFRPPIVTYGENLHSGLVPPDNARRYLLPFYEKRVGQLRDAGISTHAHLDGDLRGFLPFLKDFPHNGLEALTPEPQGDVTIDEIREHLGNHILLDGIPAILFLKTFPRHRLEDCVKRLIDQFYPRLILGISDELPMAADEESLDRLIWVSEYCSRQ